MNEQVITIKALPTNTGPVYLWVRYKPKKGYPLMPGEVLAVDMSKEFRNKKKPKKKKKK